MSLDESTTTYNQQLMRRFYEEIFNQGQEGSIERLVDPRFVDHVPVLLPSQPTRGPEALRWFVSQFRGAFPDLQVTVEDLVATGDRVAARVTWSGTHRGAFMGTDPTNRRIRVTGLDLARVFGGRIVEHWGQLDVLTMMDQLGFLPRLDETTV